MLPRASQHLLRLALPAFLAALASAPLFAQEPLTLDRVLADIRAHHPQLRADSARSAADRERIAPAASWADPIVGLEVQRDTNNRLLSYDQTEFQITQKIPLSGNRERRRAVAAAEAEVTAAGGRSREFQLLADARDAFFQLLRAREQLALLRDTDRLLAQAVEVVRSRLATGAASLNTLLAAETERAQLRERVITLEREAATATTRLNSLRDLPAQAPVGAIAPPTPPATFATLEEAQAHALAHRSELREADARIAAAARTRELADRAWRPDPEVMLRARHANAGSQVIYGYDTAVAITVPWLNNDKYRAAQREAERRREAATLDAAALRTRTAAEVRDVWQRLASSRENIALYRDRLLPLAEAAVANARSALTTSPSALPDLVAAEKNLRLIRTTLADHLADTYRLAALLATLAGADLT